MNKTALAVAALLAACNTTPPQQLPPPFGPEGAQPTRLFFPTGLASAPDGTLVVANGNFNHAFDCGTMVSIKRPFIDGIFNALDPDTNQPQECDVPDPTAALAASCKRPIRESDFGGAVLIGNYSGPMALSADGSVAYTGSRDSGRLNGVLVDPGGALHCAPGAGDGATKDCRAGVIDLTPSKVDGPYSIVPGTTILPGTTAAEAQNVFFVSSIIPHLDSINSGVPFTSTSVAVLDRQNPANLLFSMVAGSTFFADAGNAPGTMAFDGVRRRLYLMGCYQRSTAGFGGGEPGTLLCGDIRVNLLRILNVDAKDNPGIPTEIDLHADVHSSFTVEVLLGDPDPATQAPMTLWATMRLPDTLVRIELPLSPAVAPRVRKVVPLPVSPAGMVRIERPGAADLLAVVAEKANSVLIYDTGQDRVVAEVGRLGDSPYMIQQIPCPSGSAHAGNACLATSVFGECRVAFIEVPLSQPEQSALRGLAGSCP